MLTKQHFEHMAEHIARETKAGSAGRDAAMKLAISTAKMSNPRFDEGRFRSAVDGLTKGTHTVGDSGRIKRVGGSAVKKLSSGTSRGAPGAGKLYADAGKGGGGGGDEPRDDHGRWTT